MAKTVIKEIIIGLLLCLAILLILAVLLYAYIPNNKVVPEPVAYTVPEDAKQVLQESAIDTSQVILTYEVNSSDLSNAQRINNYNPGKVNPFSEYKVEEPVEQTDEGTSSTTESSSKGSSSTGSTTRGETEEDSSTEEKQTYYQDKGTK